MPLFNWHTGLVFSFVGMMLEQFPQRTMTIAPTNWRALCAELHAAVQLYTGQNPASAKIPSNELVRGLMNAMGATAAALAQPEPQGPTDEELYDLFDWLKDEWQSNNEGEFPLPVFARAVLAQWALPTPSSNNKETL